MKYFLSTLSIFSLLFLPTAFAENDSPRDRMEGQKEERKEAREERKIKSVLPQLTTTQIACVKTALDKRETTLIAGHDTYATAIKNAYTARKTALLSAWDKTDTQERRTAVRAADEAFRTAVKTARNSWNETRRVIWKTFSTERQACIPQAEGQVSASDTGSSKVDSSL